MNSYFKFIFLFLFSSVANATEFDYLKACKNLDLTNIPKLSLKNKETKQYSSLIKLLSTEKVIPLNNKDILQNFHTCWSMASWSKDSLIVEMTETGLTINGTEIKFGKTASLPSAIKKVIKKIKNKQQHDLIWTVFAESLIASTNTRFNYYVYASHKKANDVNSIGRRQQLGFIPSFIDDQIIVESIMDPKLSSAGLEVGMVVDEIRSREIKVDKKTNWWFQERAFNYTLMASNNSTKIELTASSVVQIQNSVSTVINDGLAYIQFHYFNQRTHIDVWRFLRNLDDSIHGLILDVRGNRGGNLNLKTISFFLKPHQLVGVISETDGPKNIINADVAYVGQPIIILQNENSASMSELLSAMLQKQGRAKVIGQTSFGKAAVQHVIPVLTEGTMMLVKQHMYYPDEKTSWANIGVEPDIKLDIDDEQEFQRINNSSSVDTSDEFKKRIKIDSSLRRAIAVLKMEMKNEN